MFIKLTTRANEPTIINTNHIQSLYVNKDRCDGRITFYTTIVMRDGHERWVKETVEEIWDLVNQFTGLSAE